MQNLRGPQRLAVVEMRALDARNRLALIRLDQSEHLIVLTPGGASVVSPQTGLPAKTPFEAASAE